MKSGTGAIQPSSEVTVRRARPALAWETFLGSAGNPNLPPLGVVLDEVLTTSELAAFGAHLRPLVEGGQGTERRSVAYLTAAVIDSP